MKKSNLIIAMAVWTISFSSCSNDEYGGPEAAKYINVNTSIGSLSHTIIDDKGVQSFVANNKISVYAWTGDVTTINNKSLIVNNSINTFDGTTWIATPQMLWKDVSTVHFFLGVYPSKEISNFTADTYKLNVSEQEKSDILIALNTGTAEAGLLASNNPVSLQFDHLMTKLIVNLVFRNQWDGTPTVACVTANAKSTATIDYLAKKATATGEHSSIVLPALETPNGNNTLSYASIMIPASGLDTITITIGGKPYIYAPEKEITLEPGKYTTVNLTVGRDKIETSSVSINPWGAGTTIEGGEAQND